MKKTWYGLLVVTILIISVVWSILNIKNNENTTTIDAIKFKNEYEALNTVLDDNQINKYPVISINQTNKFYYSSYDEIMNILQNGTGVIYFGYPECPWSRNAAPVLSKAANETSIDKIYYLNISSIRDKKHLDEKGNIVIDQYGTAEYYSLLEKLQSVLGSYKGLNDESIKRLYSPTTIFVKNGKIIASHSSTVDSQVNPMVLLNERQTEQLKQIYLENINKILNN